MDIVEFIEEHELLLALADDLVVVDLELGGHLLFVGDLGEEEHDLVDALHVLLHVLLHHHLVLDVLHVELLLAVEGGTLELVCKIGGVQRREGRHRGVRTLSEHVVVVERVVSEVSLEERVLRVDRRGRGR